MIGKLLIMEKNPYLLSPIRMESTYIKEISQKKPRQKIMCPRVREELKIPKASLIVLITSN